MNFNFRFDANANNLRYATKNELTEADIAFIQANTDFDREKIIAFYNDFKRKCPNNKLDKKSFIPFYKALIPGNHPDEDKFCDVVFQVFDTDSNGYIDFGEFLIAFWIRSKGSLKDKLGWLFDLYDTDKTGYINAWELSKTLKFVFGMKNISEDPYLRARKIIEQIDRNSDGRLTKQEFIYGLTVNEDLRNLLAPF